MPFKLLKDENKLRGITGDQALAGVSNEDDGFVAERGFTFPTIVDPAVSWLDYLCYPICYLDSGIAVHTPLPQRADPIDTLASGLIDDADLDENKNGVNLNSGSTAVHVAQRMASSKYRICIKGWGLRVGYQIPIPGLKGLRTASGIAPAIPDDETPQKAYNACVGNYSGVPLFFAEWELWYTVLVPPSAPLVPPPNLAEHIRADVVLPTNGEIQVPVSVPDSNAVRTSIPLTPVIER